MWSDAGKALGALFAPAAPEVATAIPAVHGRNIPAPSSRLRPIRPPLQTMKVLLPRAPPCKLLPPLLPSLQQPWGVVDLEGLRSLRSYPVQHSDVESPPDSTLTSHAGPPPT